MDQHTKTGSKKKDENTQKTWKKKWKSDFKNDIFAIKKIQVHSLMSSHQASAQALSLGKTGLSSRYRSSFYREQQQQKYIVNLIG